MFSFLDYLMHSYNLHIYDSFLFQDIAKWFFFQFTSTFYYTKYGKESDND